MTTPIAARVLRFIQGKGLLSTGEKIVVAVSGGPDSLCLLHVLLELRQELGIALHIAHLDHCLRGAESAADASYVAALAGSLGLPATIGQRDVAGYRTERRLSLEEAAREVRYGFLLEVARDAGAGTVAVGHTATDQAETILMHLIRGAGTPGLRGMAPVALFKVEHGSPLKIVRPLLELKREEVEAYCRSRGLEPRRDATNLESSPFRNRLRQELVPLLRNYNPGIEDALLRTARAVSDDLALIEEQTSLLWDRVDKEGDGYLVFDAAVLKALPPALQRSLLRKAFHRLLGSLKDIEARHVESMLSAFQLAPGRTVSLPRGLVFAMEYGRCVLGRDPAALCPFPPFEGEARLQVPGETLAGGWRVRASLASPGELQTTSNRTLLQGKGLDAALGWPEKGEILTLRTRRPGDRFQPLGMKQPKKLQDFMVDTRIPRAWRDRVPLVCSPRRILWVVGWRLSELAKPGHAPEEKTLLLEFEDVSQN